MLRSQGFQGGDVVRELRSRVLPWHGRVLWGIRLLGGGRPFAEEAALFRHLADSSSGHDIEDAFYTYRHNHSEWAYRLASRCLGLVPRQSRVLDLYRQLTGNGARV